MGRPYAGTDRTTSALTLEVGHLRRAGVLVKGRGIRATMCWASGESLELESSWTEAEPSLLLSFRDNDGETWTQAIALRTAPSPLQGELLYFVCPRSGKTCRKLYRAYYSRGFFHREAFTYRLYYPQQLSPKLSLPDYQLQAVERKLTRLRRKRRTSSYLGQPTRRAVRMEQLRAEALRLEELRWSLDYMPRQLQSVLSSIL